MDQKSLRANGQLWSVKKRQVAGRAHVVSPWADAERPNACIQSVQCPVMNSRPTFRPDQLKVLMGGAYPLALMNAVPRTALENTGLRIGSGAWFWQ